MPWTAQNASNSFKQYSPPWSVRSVLMDFPISFSTRALKLLNAAKACDFSCKKYTQVFQEKIISEGHEVSFNSIRNWINWSANVRMNQLQNTFCSPWLSLRELRMILFANNTFFTYLGRSNNLRKPRNHVFLIKSFQSSKTQVTIMVMPQPWRFPCFSNQTRLTIFNLQRIRPIWTFFSQQE